MIIEFEKLRKIKHSLPHGSIRKIAEELGLKEEAVRNYFGGTHFEHGTPEGVHFEKSSGYVRITDTAILDAALKILNKESVEEVV
jgi:AcrR family transcriptional regulator